MTEHNTMVSGSEEEFRVLFECATIGILVINQSGRIERLNSCAENLFGYTEVELLNKSIEILIPDHLRHKHTHHRDGYFANPKDRPMGVGIDLYARKKNGIVFPVEISLGHYALDGENMAVAFVTDITERKKAQQEMLESKLTLDDEAEALKELNDAGTRLWRISNLQQGMDEILRSSIALMGADKGNVQILDKEKLVLRIVTNHGFEQEFLDYFKEVSTEATSTCGQALNEKRQIIVEDTEKEWNTTMAAIARLSGFRSVQSTPLFAHDGSTIGMISTHFKKPGRPSEMTLKRMELAARKAESFIEHMKDYEIIQKQNQELEDKVNDRTRALIGSLEREKQMNELKSRFVSMASHEFRTPLSVILSSISLIEHYAGEGDDRVTKHLTKVKTAANNLTNILNDFLSLDKLEQGKVEVDWEEFDTAEFIDHVIEETSLLRKHGQHISTSHSGEKHIRSDNKKLRYVILNLLSNAIKYSSENTEITLTTNQQDDLFTITIHDRGIGIPEEEQKFLFNKFFRARNAGTIQGTGLGLTIVKLYVDLMGGNITFSSRLNEGTLFTVLLPQHHENHSRY